MVIDCKIFNQKGAEEDSAINTLNVEMFRYGFELDTDRDARVLHASEALWHAKRYMRKAALLPYAKGLAMSNRRR
jgi:hypothetical protein